MTVARLATRSALPFVALMTLAGHVMSAVAYAEGSVDVSGYDHLFQSNTGTVGAVAGADRVIGSPVGDVFANAGATSSAGRLGASSVARGNLPTKAQAAAMASWSDGFAITAPGYGPSETGHFSGSVLVIGELVAEIDGQSIADTRVLAKVNIHPDTGYNGGVVQLQGGGRHSFSYELGESRSGLEVFFLTFTNVPFTFGRTIGLTLELSVTSGADMLAPLAESSAQSLYTDTLSWQGLNEVRDAAGDLVAGYTAVSADSGFDYGRPIPEPSTAGLMVLGGLFVALSRLRRRTARHPEWSRDS